MLIQRVLTQFLRFLVVFVRALAARYAELPPAKVGGRKAVLFCPWRGNRKWSDLHSRRSLRQVGDAPGYPPECNAHRGFSALGGFRLAIAFICEL